MKTAICAASVSLFLFAAAAVAAPANSPGQFTGVVDSVMDGDLIRVVLDEGESIPPAYRTCSKVYSTMAWVRFYGVKAPDPMKKEPCGKDAKEFLRRLALGKKVRVDVTGCTPGGGLGGVVTLENGLIGAKDINMEMIKAGLARVGMRAYGEDRPALLKKYYEAEKKAMMDALGLWAKKPCGGK